MTLCALIAVVGEFPHSTSTLSSMVNLRLRIDLLEGLLAEAAFSTCLQPAAHPATASGTGVGGKGSLCDSFKEYRTRTGQE